jgi:F420-dependent oxidoreductase-like protein
MRLGVHIGYWGLGLSSADQLEIVQEAERLGYDSVWTAEAYGSDAATILGWLAGQTSTIKLGSGILQMPARSAAATAMTAATLDVLSGGRFLLGIGSSGPQVSEGWHGVRFAKQLARTRDYVAVLRKALARERLEYHGETLDLPLPDGPGKALKLTITPVQERIPIYIAAIGPRNTQLAGEIADGVMPTLFSPEHVSVMRDELQAGIDRAGNGKTLADVDVAPQVQVMVTDDLERARDVMRPVHRASTSAAWARARRTSTTSSCSATASRTPRGRSRTCTWPGRRDEAMAAVPAELIDLVSICGPREVVASAWRPTATRAWGRWA